MLTMSYLQRCLTLQNFHTLMAILAALNSSTIARLKKTWEGLSNKYKAILEVLRKATECSRNYAEYRSHIRTAVAPCLPFLGIYLTDITFCFDGNPSHRASPLEANLRLINFDRYQRIARIVSDLQRFQQPFNLIEVPEIQTFLHGGASIAVPVVFYGPLADSSHDLFLQLSQTSKTGATLKRCTAEAW